jgi:hypothetical protein
MMLAAQLPENSADARLIIQAVTELMDTFLADGEGEAPARATNI